LNICVLKAQQTRGTRNTVQLESLKKYEKGGEFTDCSSIYDSCIAGRKKGLSHASPTVCEDRLAACKRTGEWRTNHQGTIRGLRRE
jgi:hypothetical protein